MKASRDALISFTRDQAASWERRLLARPPGASRSTPFWRCPRPRGWELQPNLSARGLILLTFLLRRRDAIEAPAWDGRDDKSLLWAPVSTVLASTVLRALEERVMAGSESS